MFLIQVCRVKKVSFVVVVSGWIFQQQYSPASRGLAGWCAVVVFEQQRHNICRRKAEWSAGEEAETESSLRAQHNVCLVSTLSVPVVFVKSHRAETLSYGLSHQIGFSCLCQRNVKTYESVVKIQTSFSFDIMPFTKAVNFFSYIIYCHVFSDITLCVCVFATQEFSRPWRDIFLSFVLSKNHRHRCCGEAVRVSLDCNHPSKMEIDANFFFLCSTDTKE